MSYTTPPRSSLIRDALAALADSPNPQYAAQSQAAELRQRDRAFRDFQAAHRSPGGRGDEAGAVDLVSLFGASGREFVPGPGIGGRAMEMSQQEASASARSGGGAAAPFQALSQTSAVSAR
nr:hypothetical protein [Crucivirus sp.]